MILVSRLEHVVCTHVSANIPSVMTGINEAFINHPSICQFHTTILTSSRHIQMDQGTSDVFDPDNLNSRNCAEQLTEDILAYLNAYDEIKKVTCILGMFKAQLRL